MQQSRNKFTSFIAQRMEMGESEWYFKPPVARVDDIAAQIPPPAADTPGTGVLADSTVPPPVGDDGGSYVCGAGKFDVSVIQTRNDLDSLNGTVCGCQRCPLGETRTKFVFGAGNASAGLMFVGEAPGADEDREGIPFIGRAGQLLTSMIKAIRLEREDVYIGNILKCRPPGNRDPRPDEIAACEPILIRQIEIIKPRVICALGRIAASTLLRSKSSLGAMRGVVHDYHGVKLIATYHPAALLRNPHWKRPAWDDLKFLRREFDGLEIT